MKVEIRRKIIIETESKADEDCLSAMLIKGAHGIVYMGDRFGKRDSKMQIDVHGYSTTVGEVQQLVYEVTGDSI